MFFPIRPNKRLFSEYTSYHVSKMIFKLAKQKLVLDTEGRAMVSDEFKLAKCL